MGVLPVLIITEMKHDWEHWKKMGFQIDDVIDNETGEILDQTGFFIYRDRSTLNSIEDIAEFIIDLLTDNVLAPRLMGELIGLNPVWIFIALFIGAKIGGVLGLLLAIPIASVTKQIIDDLR
jgi:hypothetical protein